MTKKNVSTVLVSFWEKSYWCLRALADPFLKAFSKNLKGNVCVRATSWSIISCVLDYYQMASSLFSIVYTQICFWDVCFLFQRVMTWVACADMAKLHFVSCSLLIPTETSKELQHNLSLEWNARLMSVCPSDREVFVSDLSPCSHSGIVTPLPPWMGEHKATGWVLSPSVSPPASTLTPYSWWEYKHWST